MLHVANPCFSLNTHWVHFNKCCKIKIRHTVSVSVSAGREELLVEGAGGSESGANSTEGRVGEVQGM